MEEPPASIPGQAQIIFDRLEYTDNLVAPEQFSKVSEMREKPVLVPETVMQGTTLSLIWQATISSNTTFFKDYHEKRGDTNVAVTPWIFMSDRSSGTRFLSCKTNVDGSMEEFNEAHRFVWCRDTIGPDQSGKLCNRLLLQLSAQTPNVMMGTTFRAETLFDFSEEIVAQGEDSPGVRVVVYGACRKMKGIFSMIRGIADSRAVKDLITAYSIYMQMMTDALQVERVALKEPPSGPPAQAPSKFAMLAQMFGDVDKVTIVLLIMLVVCTLFTVHSFLLTRSLTAIVSSRSSSAGSSRHVAFEPPKFVLSGSLEEALLQHWIEGQPMEELDGGSEHPSSVSSSHSQKEQPASEIQQLIMAQQKMLQRLEGDMQKQHYVWIGVITGIVLVGSCYFYVRK